MDEFLDVRGMGSIKPLLWAKQNLPLGWVLGIRMDKVRRVSVGSTRPAPLNRSRPETSCVLDRPQGFLITHGWGSPASSGRNIRGSPSICRWGIID